MKTKNGLGSVPGGGDFVVSGNKRYNSWFIKADRIIFESGATLIFSREALDSRRHFFIIAREVICKDGNAPGKITWEKGAVQSVSAAGGQAPTGPEPGGIGATGAKGAQGYEGHAAPALTLVVLSTPSSGPMIDFTGQQGGIGAQGQKGGSGGHGGTGESAAQNAPEMVVPAVQVEKAGMAVTEARAVTAVLLIFCAATRPFPV